MTVDQLRQAREAVPFRPFTLYLADGRSHRVIHRDYVSTSPGGRMVTVYHSDESGSIIDLFLVTELKLDAVPADIAPVAGGASG